MTHDAAFFRHARRVIVLRAVFLAVLAAGLAGCASQSPSVFRTAGASAHDIAVLTYTMFAILSAVLITVWSLLAWVLIRYRERPDREPSQTRGNTRIEVVWTVIPAIIVAVLFALTMQTTGKLIDPAGPVQFTVTGHQWWWQVSYAGADFETANEIHIPAGTTVSADLLSADVIHGFWVPQLAGKVQLIPGHVNHITILPVVPGTYLGVCANFCGMGHA
jgi:cytochrome c oxidase subunit 2